MSLRRSRLNYDEIVAIVDSYIFMIQQSKEFNLKSAEDKLGMAYVLAAFSFKQKEELEKKELIETAIYLRQIYLAKKSFETDLFDFKIGLN